MYDSVLRHGTNYRRARNRLTLMRLRGTLSVASKWDLLKRAEMLVRLAKQAAPADPALAASFVRRAADLKEEAESLEPLDAPDIEKGKGNSVGRSPDSQEL